MMLITATSSCRLKTRCFRHTIALVFLSLGMVYPLCVRADQLNPPSLDSSHTNSDAGYFTLHWKGAESSPEQTFLLQQSTLADFSSAHILYHGSDSSRVISGLGDGQYYYRVRATLADTSSEWSRPVLVQVKHHSLTEALIFFIAGAIVFVFTLIFLISSSRRNRVS